MNKLKKLFLVFLGVSLFFTVLLVADRSLMQTREASVQKQKNEDLPVDKKWSVSFHPYLKDDYTDSPLMITSVASKEAAVKNFEIANISTKSIVGMRVGWLVYSDDESQNLLFERESPHIRFFDELGSGKGGRIDYSVTSLKKLYQYLPDDKQLNRDFDVELLVDEVNFSDGSVWKKEDGRSKDISTKLESSSSAGPCGKTKCKAVSNPDSNNGGVFYTCEGSQVNEYCQVGSGQLDCTNSACNRPGGGGGGIGIIIE